MRVIALALVVVALCAGSLAGDLLPMSQHDQDTWDLCATAALIVFAWAWQDDRKREIELDERENTERERTPAVGFAVTPPREDEQ